MCGRFTLDPTTKLFERFKIDNRLDGLTARYNIAPSQDVPVIIRQSPNRIVMMRWGLIPHWAKDESIGSKMINARAETITEKPSFKRLLPSKRCIVPASGYYEWQKTEGNGKQPFYIHDADDAYLPFAGLYTTWKNPEGQEIHSFTIITTSPTVNLQAIHDRMPVILEPDAEDVWLNPDVTDPGALTPLLHPYTIRALDFYPVSKAVNRAGVDSRELIQKAIA
jgi:putative SOS response-associated peptidase YedK